ncbi:hypothetical protein OsJ_07078 [Oryza sativa Japonica Group]|uniref:Uncharacterized protein n=1 Tax=Oryza sativa subsp. japonica TaxID=39947 RepID=B9F0G9_ORYSJ|nr:hypothetical protein OsJ_07078 [Oryza sativa Japonica Group]
MHHGVRVLPGKRLRRVRAWRACPWPAPSAPTTPAPRPHCGGFLLPPPATCCCFAGCLGQRGRGKAAKVEDEVRDAPRRSFFAWPAGTTRRRTRCSPRSRTTPRPTHGCRSRDMATERDEARGLCVSGMFVVVVVGGDGARSGSHDGAASAMHALLLAAASTMYGVGGRRRQRRQHALHGIRPAAQPRG